MTASRSVACSSCPTPRSCPSTCAAARSSWSRSAVIGSAIDGAALVQPLRDLGPELDTVAMMPTSELSVVNMDPDFPLPYTGDGILLTDLTREAIDRMVEAFVGSPLLHVEVRHLGRRGRRPSPEHGVLDAIDQPFVALHVRAHSGRRRRIAAVDRHVHVLLDALGPWDSGRRYLNFAESRVDPRSIFPRRRYDRLKRGKGDATTRRTCSWPTIPSEVTSRPG